MKDNDQNKPITDEKLELVPIELKLKDQEAPEGGEPEDDVTVVNVHLDACVAG